MTGPDGRRGRHVATLGVAATLALSLLACGGGDDDSGGRDEDAAATEEEAPQGWDERVAPIAEWVAANYTAQTVGSTTIYDLS